MFSFFSNSTTANITVSNVTNNATKIAHSLNNGNFNLYMGLGGLGLFIFLGAFCYQQSKYCVSPPPSILDEKLIAALKHGGSSSAQKSRSFLNWGYSGASSV